MYVVGLAIGDARREGSMTKFGELLRKERKKAGKTLGEVATVLDCAISYLSDVELSRRKPFKTAQIVRIAEELGCDAQRLIMAAAKENGGVIINSGNARVSGIAAGLARSGERLAPEALAQIEKLLQAAEQDED
jgi:transcriptional regulator with XRE-family HTH domain